jgi:hypothetical protein
MAIAKTLTPDIDRRRNQSNAELGSVLDYDNRDESGSWEIEGDENKQEEKRNAGAALQPQRGARLTRRLELSAA